MVTLTQVARHTRFSLATVSYALRDDPRISPDTREAIKRVAAELGYRPNPRFSALMSHIRSSRPISAGEKIAFVWVRTSKAESTSDSYLRKVFAGAKARAESLGYAIEQFWTDEHKMTDRRLSNILRARGIIGLLLSPVVHQAEVSLDFDWPHFAPAVIGATKWAPELHHSGHHHYLAMQNLLDRLEEMGLRRPFALLDPKVNERARRAWEAAFLTRVTPVRRSPAPLLMCDPNAMPATFTRKIAAYGADSLVVSNGSLVTALKRRGIALPPIKTATLHWTEAQPEFDGIDQCYDAIAANAVDLVTNQLINNERGVPILPRMMLFPGRWVQSRKD